ncbi:aminodeoxychorismate synthase, component I [Bacillus sp. ISL-35]|uniref:aminodeoxychorismate synthase, component I n=1 Tax=Bacillus sp. ISL-35 TaxID=2819122 RepID=UPI001BEA66C8|nr:aminodeoxychorismate synthase, component I [Bacillus sp. ISL-35]MBT2679212.1 aminodeoxychorismate synthase, component I [Bacillus sp. ISL-35]MBT2706257.1 aminodeoxychorismate synthase, component I [Chryseobacterium sp. ISL-80]
MDKEKKIGVTSLPHYSIHTQSIPYTASRFFHQYDHIAQQYKEHVILESGRGGRYSIAAFQPEVIFSGKDHKLTISKNGMTTTLEGNPLELMKQEMEAYKVPEVGGLPDFQGGAIGYISYDYARYIEKLPQMAKDDSGIPEVYFQVYMEWFVFNHQTETLWIMALSEPGQEERTKEKLTEWQKRWEAEALVMHAEKADKPGYDVLHVSMDEDTFIDAVERVQQYISQGDVFQVNLSVRQSKPVETEAIEVYRQLRQLNPSPYMGYLHTADFQLVSGSPELLAKVNGTEVSTRPIAGTRSRGRTDQEDLQLANELINNEKERAEHVMLVDLERNDLGRVCRYGTVEVDEFMVIEKYSHVMHIVSNVRGELAEGETWFDVVNATFPGGTITGAPKVRTMEIIEELEPVRRGPYTGSLGWIGFNGNMELNIIIRTMLVKDGMAHVQAGAGVVIDSIPANEYKESLKKAIALWKAKELAEGNA